MIADDKCTCPQKDYGDGYHRRDCPAVQPLTFEEWWEKHKMFPAYLHVAMDIAELIWNASRANL